MISCSGLHAYLAMIFVRQEKAYVVTVGLLFCVGLFSERLRMLSALYGTCVR